MQVKCKSGLIGWRKRLRASYDNSFDAWKVYATTYGLAQKLGYATSDGIERAWSENPLIEGSTDPSDYRVWSYVNFRLEWKYKGCNIIPVTGEKPKYFGLIGGVSGRVMYRSKYWRVNFSDDTWCYCGTKEDCRKFIDMPRNDMR